MLFSKNYFTELTDDLQQNIYVSSGIPFGSSLSLVKYCLRSPLLIVSYQKENLVGFACSRDELM